MSVWEVLQMDEGEVLQRATASAPSFAPPTSPAWLLIAPPAPGHVHRNCKQVAAHPVEAWLVARLLLPLLLPQWCGDSLCW